VAFFMRMSRRRIRRLCATIAAAISPWALAGGMLVSFTASASNDPAWRPTLSAHRAHTPRQIAADAAAPLIDGRVRVASIAADWRFASRAESVDRIARDATLLAPAPAEGPRIDLKHERAAFPDVDRTLKGDPLLALRPSLSRVAPADPGAALAQAMFEIDEESLVLSVFRLRGAPDAPAGFVRRKISPPPAVLREEVAGASPQAAASTPTQDLAETGGGATPLPPRAVALASATPAPADATPIAIAAAPVSAPPGVTAVARGPARPRYADLVTPATMAAEIKCLSEAVYFEARSEPEAGQAAVAQVVLNRAKSGLYPSSVCGVVYQNRHRYLACQFTFACEGKSLRITDPDSWRAASRVARAVFDGREYNEEVGAATHYHARYVRPAWAKRLKRMDVIGQHVFYRLRPGQT
jgi:spore germination cell wall hydrolase CwlJ-like protein